MSAADVAAYHRWLRILRWAEGHEPTKAQRARDVMQDIYDRLLEDYERKRVDSGVARRQ